MSIFISWSGDRSHAIARGIKKLLLATVRTLRDEDVFISDQIEKGMAWFDAIAEELQRSQVGIVCLTPENLQSPWLHFEAGALARRMTEGSPSTATNENEGTPEPRSSRHRNQLFTVLHGVTGAEVRGPLSAYHATSTTRAEMGDLFRSVARILDDRTLAVVDERAARRSGIRNDQREREPRQTRSVIAPAHWAEFEETLAHLMAPARTLVPELDQLFQRKTFNEPLNRCADQAWGRRYDGARVTYEQLKDNLPRVQAACSPAERGLFEMLLAELDGYAMALQSRLLEPQRFEPLPDGELKIDPDILSMCEDRRLAIRSLSGRLLHPLDEPMREEAVRFMGAETHEERKMIVHRFEAAIRREREVVFEADPDHQSAATWFDAVGRLTAKRRPMQFRESSWDFDRICYYLLVYYFETAALRWEPNTRAERGAPTPLEVTLTPMAHDWLCAARDVEMEVERYGAKAKGRSLMPLAYALTVLSTIDQHTSPDVGQTRRAVLRAVELVDTELSTLDLQATESGRTIERELRRLRGREEAVVPSRLNPTPATRAAATR